MEKAAKENGIRLLIFGEHLAFGAGGYKKSIIEKMLPVSMPDIYDLVKAPAQLVISY